MKLKSNDSQNKQNQAINRSIDNINYLFEHQNRNFFINGGCQVSQRLTDTINLSSSYQYGQVDRIAGKVANNGFTISGQLQQVDLSQSKTGKAFNAYISSTGSGNDSYLHIIYRMEARDSIKFKNNNSGSLNFKVFSDLTDEIQIKILFNYASSENDFTTVYNLYEKILDSYNYNSETKEIKIENINFLKDGIENGLEIELQFIINTTFSNKNIYLFDFNFVLGSKCLDYIPDLYCNELRKCQRYYNRKNLCDSANGFYSFGFVTSSTDIYFNLDLNQLMVKIPSMETTGTLTNYNILCKNGGSGSFSPSTLTLDTNNTTYQTACIKVTTTGLTFGDPAWLRNNGITNGHLSFNAEL